MSNVYDIQYLNIIIHMRNLDLNLVAQTVEHDANMSSITSG